MTSSSSDLRSLLGRTSRRDGLPSLHMDFSARDYARAVFDGESVPVRAGLVDPADVCGSVFEQVRATMAAEFANGRRGSDRPGSRVDCERMAEGAARR